jgi:hypothetical protein
VGKRVADPKMLGPRAFSVPGSVDRTRRPVRTSSGAGRATRAGHAPGGGVLAGVDGQRRATFPRGIATRGSGVGQVWVRRRARGGNHPRTSGDGALAPLRDLGMEFRLTVSARQRVAAARPRPAACPPASPTIRSRGVVGPSESLQGAGRATARANALRRFSRLRAAIVGRRPSAR